MTYIQPGRPYRTTGRHGYHSANWWSYNYNTSLPGSSPASSLCSSASSCELYFEKGLWSQIRMNALEMKFYCLSCGIVTFKFAVLKLIKLKLSKMYIKWERWSVLGWVKKERCFFGLVTSVGQRKILFVCFFSMWFCFVIVYFCLFVNFHLFLCTFFCFCSHLFLSFFLCSSYNNKTQTSL